MGRYKMPLLSRRIQENQRKHSMEVLRLATAEMEPGQKRKKKSYFGYKLHQKSDIDYGHIREIETTTAKLHDRQVDLSIEGEVVIRDRGYFGVPARGDDFTMVRRTTDAPLGE